jgi:hypothetical protein
MPNLQKIFALQRQTRAVLEDMLDRQVIFLVAIHRVRDVETLFIIARGEEGGGLAVAVVVHRAVAFEHETMGVVVAVVSGELIVFPIFRQLGDHVDHTAGRRAAVDRGIGALDDFQAIDVARAVTPEPVEAVPQLRGGAEAAERKAAADVEAGETADLGYVVGELEHRKVLEEFRREDIHGVRKIDDWRADATASHRLGCDVPAITFGGDVELGKRDHVPIARVRRGSGGRSGGRGTRGRRARSGLRAEAGGESERDERESDGTSPCDGLRSHGVGA